MIAARLNKIGWLDNPLDIDLTCHLSLIEGSGKNEILFSDFRD